MENNNQVKTSLKLNFSIRILNNLLFVLILILGVAYMTNVNDLSVRGFALQDLQKQVSELNEEKEDLELRMAYLKSYNYLDQLIIDKQYVAADIEYIDLGDVAAVARN